MPKVSLGIRRLILATAFVVLIAANARPVDQSAQAESSQEPTTQLDPPTPGVSGDEIFRELLQHNDMRNAELKQYSAIRTYEVINPSGKLYARQVVRLDYRAPDTKMFMTTFEEGSGLVRHMVFKRLIESETDAAAGKEHHDSSITPANYSFELLGEEQAGPYYCFVIQATPTRQDKYLFEGTIWIDAQDFAIVKISGHPAKRPSFWIERADFVRQYQKIGQFWLPLKDETVVHVRLKGIKILMIDHGDYAVNEGTPEKQEVQSSDDTAKQFVSLPTTVERNPEESDQEGYR
jgi:hypothetical protein